MSNNEGIDAAETPVIFICTMYDDAAMSDNTEEDDVSLRNDMDNNRKFVNHSIR
jgi:hypothetical protein